MTKRRANLATARTTKDRAPLIEHLHELKRRLFYVVVSIAAGSALAYGTEQHLIAALLRPSHGQHFIYTSPLGGINFIFSVCLYVGIALSLPVIVYHFLKFFQPLMKDTNARFIGLASIASGIVALGGITFGYFLGLPAALHFLLHQFHSNQIQALLTIEAYLSFVMAYILGSALMFQLPLIMIIINRIKPLKPSQLFKYERLVVIFAFVVGFIMNPTPNLLDQMLVVVPIILMYQFGIGLIWVINRHNNHERFRPLHDHDAETRNKRTEWAQQLVSAVSDVQPASLQPAFAPVIVEDDEPFLKATAQSVENSVNNGGGLVMDMRTPARPRPYANAITARPDNRRYERSTARFIN